MIENHVRTILQNFVTREQATWEGKMRQGNSKQENY